jgi:hypothetical protein
VKSTITSVVVGLRVFIVVPLVDIGKDEDREEYSVELIRFSIAVEMELDKSSVYSEEVVAVCVFSIVFSVVPVRSVDDGKVNDSVRVATVSDVID